MDFRNLDDAEFRKEEIVISFYSFDRDLRGDRDCNWRRAARVGKWWPVIRTCVGTCLCR